MKSDGRQVHGVGTRRRSRIAIAFLQCLAIALVLPVVQATPAAARSDITCRDRSTWRYARNGTPLVLTVTTARHEVRAWSRTTARPRRNLTTAIGRVWTFNFTAGTGSDGTKTVDVIAWKQRAASRGTDYG